MRDTSTRIPHAPTAVAHSWPSEWLSPFLGRWRVLAAAFALGGLGGIGGSYLITPTFVATTTFIPPQQQNLSASAALASLGAIAGLAGVGGGGRSTSDQYVSLMQSVRVSDRLIDQFDLQQVYGARLRQDARQSLLEHAQIQLGKKDGFISIMVEDVDPARAAAIANQYVAELRAMTSELAVTEAQQRRAFFEKQMQDVRAKLDAAQRALQGSGFALGDLRAEPRAAAEVYANLRAELTAAEVEIQTLSINLAPGAPAMARQAAKVQALRSKLADAERASKPQDKGQPDYISRYREYKYQETLFDLMARQYELAKVDESREGALIQVIDVAAPAEHKSRPKRLVFGINAAIGAFLAAAVVILSRQRRVTAPG